MATLKTMNRRRRRVIEPGVILQVFEVRGENYCSSYERYQGRRVSRYQVRGAPFYVCQSMAQVDQDAEEMAAQFQKLVEGFTWE